MSRSRSIMAIVAALSALVLVPVVAQASPPPATGYVYGGMYADQYDASTVLDPAAAFAGRPHTFGGLFTTVESNAANTDRILEEQWESRSTPFVNVISDQGLAVGATAIQTWAQGVKAWTDKGGERSVIIAPFQEMNGSWTEWGCQPAAWKATYARFRQAFADVGLNETQVRWAFAPNGYTSPGCGGMGSYYPGDDAADIVAFSSYNYGPKNWDGRYWGPAEVFGPWLDEIRTFAPDKPVIIAQTGTAPEGGDRDAWLRDTFAYLAADPNAVGLIYFNIDKTWFGGNEWDWRVFFGAGDSRNVPGYRDAMTAPHTAYAWPLRSWFRPGPLSFGPVVRTAGESRVGTSVKASQAVFSNATHAVVAPWGLYAYALVGGPLAAAGGGPVLISNPDFLPDEVRSELQRLAPDLVYVMGRPDELSQAVQDAIEAAGFATQRIQGADEFAVSHQVALLVGGTSAYVVEGRNPSTSRGWPDAVSVSGLAAHQQRPILLVERDVLPAATRDAIRDLSIDDVTIVGGPVAVSQQVEDAIADEGVTLQPRLAGETRYSTSLAVAQRMVDVGMSPARTWLATGTNWPDAIGAGPAVAQDGGVLLLVHGALMEGSPEARQWLRSHDFERVRLLGGPIAISMHVEGEALGVVG